jgi:hypothetical protein
MRGDVRMDFATLLDAFRDATINLQRLLQGPMSEHLRELDQRLAEIGLAQELVPGDGNCFFHALVLQLQRAKVPLVPEVYRRGARAGTQWGEGEEGGGGAGGEGRREDDLAEEDPVEVARAVVVDYLEGHQHLFENYVSALDEVPNTVGCHKFGAGGKVEGGDASERYQRYLRRMRCNGEWAGELEMMAAAHCYQVHLICYAVTPGGLSEYSYSGDADVAGARGGGGGGEGAAVNDQGARNTCNNDRSAEGTIVSGEDGADNVESKEGSNRLRPTLRLCLHREHYWSTRPLPIALQELQSGIEGLRVDSEAADSGEGSGEEEESEASDHGESEETNPST